MTKTNFVHFGQDSNQNIGGSANFQNFSIALANSVNQEL